MTLPDHDAANPTGAFGLYERLGFTTIRRNTMFGRYVPADEPLRLIEHPGRRIWFERDITSR